MDKITLAKVLKAHPPIKKITPTHKKIVCVLLHSVGASLINSIDKLPL